MSIEKPSSSEKRLRPWSAYPPGFNRFAAFIATDPDRSTTIYKRFERLSAKNLLYMESELAELESELEKIDDDCDSKELVAMGQSWELLNFMASDDEEDLEVRAKAQARLVLIAKLRDKLKEYYEALKLASDVMTFERPKKRPLKGARRIFAGGEKGNKMIRGAMERHLEDENDLCVLSAGSEPDRLTRLFEDRFAFMFRKQKNDPNIVLHQDVKFVVTVISTIAATLLLIGAVLALYFVTNPGARLGMLSGFTVFFALTLGLLTNAHRQEVFAATAAYAAVLVVFVSGDLASSSSSDKSSPEGATTNLTRVVTSVTTATSLITTTSIFTNGPTFTQSVVYYVVPGYTDMGTTVTGSSGYTDTGATYPAQTLSTVTLTSSAVTPSTTAAAISSPDHLSAGTVAGIAVGVTIGVIGLAGMLFLILICRRKRRIEPDQPKPETEQAQWEVNRQGLPTATASSSAGGRFFDDMVVQDFDSFAECFEPSSQHPYGSQRSQTPIAPSVVPSLGTTLAPTLAPHHLSSQSQSMDTRESSAASKRKT